MNRPSRIEVKSRRLMCGTRIAFAHYFNRESIFCRTSPGTVVKTSRFSHFVVILLFERIHRDLCGRASAHTTTKSIGQNEHKFGGCHWSISVVKTKYIKLVTMNVHKGVVESWWGVIAARVVNMNQSAPTALRSTRRLPRVIYIFLRFSCNQKNVNAPTRNDGVGETEVYNNHKQNIYSNRYEGTITFECALALMDVEMACLAAIATWFILIHIIIHKCASAVHYVWMPGPLYKWIDDTWTKCYDAS